MRFVDLIASLPLLALAASVLLVLLAISFFRSRRIALALALAGLIGAFVSLFWTSPTGTQVTPLLRMDPYSAIFTGLVLISAIVVLLLSSEMLEGIEAPEEYYLLLLTSTLGSSVLASSTHFVSFFLGLEILSISLYALIAYRLTVPEGSKHGLEASVKYVVLAGTSSAFLLFGMALIFNSSGSLEFLSVAETFARSDSSTALWVGSAFLLVGIGFKLALAPFHMWAPDVYEGAPAPVTAFIASASKGAVFAVLLRYSLIIRISPGSPLFIALSILAIASIGVGNLLGLYQRNLKRLLAYSSTAHLGYLLIALLAGKRLGAPSVIFYFAAYFAMTLIAFGAVAALRDQGDLESYRGLFWRRPTLASLLTIALFSLAGIPFTAGFTAKFFLLGAGIDARLWGLAFVLVIGSAIGLFYYLRVIATMAAAPPPASMKTAPPIEGAFRWSEAALASMAVALILGGIYPGPFFAAVQAAVRRIGP